MRVELTGRHIHISQAFRTLVDRKLAKVRRVLNNAGVSAAIVLTQEKVNRVAEITLHARGEQFLHAVGKADTWETAMTRAVAKVLHQTEKVKGKWQERKRRGPAARSVKTPRAARRAVARAAAPVSGGVPTSERRPSERGRPADAESTGPAVRRRVVRPRR